MSTTTLSHHPTSFGVLLFPGFQALDVFGPVDALNLLSLKYKLELSIIAATLDPVSTKVPAEFSPQSSNFAECVVPTHTYIDHPPLDVLIIPGGLGTRVKNIDSTIEFIRETYPSLGYLITVCTGSGLAARAGVLDGKRATTNKRAWSAVTALGPNVDWIAHARWVVDGNTYTSSGVSAGIDVIFAFIKDVFGSDVADDIVNKMEYERHTDPDWDPFADLNGL